MAYRHYGGMHLEEMFCLNQLRSNESPWSITEAKYIHRAVQKSEAILKILGAKLQINLERVKYKWEILGKYK